MTAPRLPALELRGLTKRFGNVLANAGVNLRVEPGTIHGVIGENGAGKSTAMKLLYGMLRPDDGEIFVGGRKRIWASPSDAIAAGIGMVHQHFMLAGPYSALDNILLGAEPLRWGVIDRAGARARLAALARQYGLPVDWDRPVEELSGRRAAARGNTEAALSRGEHPHPGRADGGADPPGNERPVRQPQEGSAPRARPCCWSPTSSRT